MAGQPRSRAIRADLQRKKQSRHRRAWLSSELRVSKTSVDRLMAVVDSLRGVVKRCELDHDTNKRIDQITRQLSDLENELLTQHAKNRRKAA